MSSKSKRLLIAASGTGGHLFPALALAQQLSDYHILWLGVADRLEQSLVPKTYPLHVIPVEGLQKPFGLGTVRTIWRFLSSIWQTKRILQREKIDLVFSTGGYIAAPAIIAARLQGIPAMIHESNFIPGKVTKFLANWCQMVALGFEGSSRYFKPGKTVYVGTPVRSQFRQVTPLDLPIPDDATLIVAMGGSQGAVALNQLVRESAPAWFKEGAFVVHLTGDRDPDAASFQHPQYLALPFYDNMAGLLQRADLAVSRAGAGALTELAVTQTPAILIPYPYAAEDHQFYNARVFQEAGAALLYRQSELTTAILEQEVLDLLQNRLLLAQMRDRMVELAIVDSAERLATIIAQF